MDMFLDFSELTWYWIACLTFLDCIILTFKICMIFDVSKMIFQIIQTLGSFWPNLKILHSSCPKEKNEEFNERVRQAMLVPGASESACAKICEIMSGEKQVNKFYKFKTAFLQSFRNCLQEVTPQALDEGEHVPFLVGKPQKLLQQFCKQQEYSKLIDDSLQRYGGKLTFCLYHDDCIAGNVLGPLKQSKCTLYYGSFIESWLLYISLFLLHLFFY